MTKPTPSSCPKCAAPIAEDAPQGLCPKCLLMEVATVSGEVKASELNASRGKTSPPSLEEVGGHASPEIHQLYTHTDAQALERAVNALPSLDGKPQHRNRDGGHDRSRRGSGACKKA